MIRLTDSRLCTGDTHILKSIVVSDRFSILAMQQFLCGIDTMNTPHSTPVLQRRIDSDPHIPVQSPAPAMTDRIWYLQRCQLFEKLSTEELQQLESASRLKTYPKGATLYFPDDAADSLFVIVEGRVRLVSITPDGKQAILALFGPGDLFGELSLVGAEQRDDFAETIVASKVLNIPRPIVESVMQRNASLSLGITKLIGFRRRRIERRLRSLLFRSNRDRLASLLWELVEQYGRSTPEGVLIDLKLSHQDLASLIGVTRESVTISLGELQSAGMIAIGRQKVVIRNLTSLSETVGENPEAIRRQLALQAGGNL